VTVQRKNPDHIHGFATRAEAEKYCDQDLLIRTGMCPNGCGLMVEFVGGDQTCEKCGFWCNTKRETTNQ
jgi:hypothetical protein